MKLINYCYLALFLSFNIATSQFVEDFDEGLDIPLNWTTINNLGAPEWLIEQPVTSYSYTSPLTGTNVAGILHDGEDINHDDYLIAPQINVVQGVNDRFSFWVTSYIENADIFEVVLSTQSATNPADFSTIVYSETRTRARKWTFISVDLSSYIGQSVYVAIHAISKADDYPYAILIDHVVSDGLPVTPETRPSCISNFSPVNGATNVPLNPTITWDIPTSSGASPIFYNVYRFLDNSNLNYQIGTTATNSFVLNSVYEYNKIYRYKIVPFNLAGEAFNCINYTFTTTGAPTDCLYAASGAQSINVFTPSVCNGYTQNIFPDETFGIGNSECGTYSLVNVQQGNKYTFISSLNGVYFTVSEDNGATAVLSGVTPLTYTATSTGVIRVYKHDDNQCGSFGQFDFSIICTPASCTPPTVNFQITSNCDVSESFYVNAILSNMGTATTVALSDNQNSPNQNANLPTTLTFGPYNNGTPVTISVANAQNTACNFTSHILEQNFCPPSNDNLIDAEPIACGNVYQGDTNGATQDVVGQDFDTIYAPLFGSYEGNYPNVWYSFTGDGTQQKVTLSNCDSDEFDSTIAVYKETNSGLSIVAFGDDDINCSSNNDLSSISFESDGTSTYYISVSGNIYTDDEGEIYYDLGEFNLQVDCTPFTNPIYTNQSCATSTNVPTNGTIVNADNTNVAQTLLYPECSDLNDIVPLYSNWFNFTAPTSGIIKCTLKTITNSDLGFIIYDGSCNNLNPLGNYSCFNIGSTPNGDSKLIGDLIPGHQYYIQCWSELEDEGSYTIKIEELSDFPIECTNDEFGQYPLSEFIPSVCDGVTDNVICTDGKAGEYSYVRIEPGQTYVFRSNVPTDIITINLYDSINYTFSGTTPFEWTAPSDLLGINYVSFYLHTNDQCGIDGLPNRTRSVVCGQSLNSNENEFDNKIKFYPNPVENLLNIEHVLPIERLEIYNLMGQLIIEKINFEKNEIDLSNLKSGIYMIRYSINDVVNTIKIIKK